MTTDPALIERMEKLVRAISEMPRGEALYREGVNLTAESRAIAALLPDKDTEAAREIVAKWSGGPCPFVGHMSAGSLALQELVLTAIKHGRANPS